MKWFRLVLCCCLFLLGEESAPAEPKEKAAPELAWARGIANDFWEAILQGDEEPAAGLLSPELTQSLLKSDRGAISYLQWIREATVGRVFVRPIEPKQTVAYTSEELAPDKNETAFKGTLSERGVIKADFTIRIAKEASGKWSIRYVRFKERDSTPPPAPPGPAPARSPDTPR
jgi:hypothetical protein